MDVLRHVIAEEEEVFASFKPVFLNQVCIFKYVYPNKFSNEDVTQIGVGLIVNIHGDDPASPQQTFDIRFFPPRGAKPQTSKHPYTLYQSINADMSFNMNFTVKKGGRRVSDISYNVPKDALLAWNLHLNKTSGSFTHKRGVEDSIYNLSSYQLADTVIRKYYGNMEKLQEG